MKTRNFILIALVVTVVVSSAFYLSSSSTSKIVYVQLNELYNGFEMKKQLENSYLLVQKGRKQQLDSLELELKLLSNRIDREGTKSGIVELFELKRESYFKYKDQFAEDDALMKQQYSEKIQKQLNQYVSDYGKEHKYEYILGAEGSGTIMFGKDENDITKDVLAFINKKFSGVKLKISVLSC